jgi:hypothetical protein
MHPEDLALLALLLLIGAVALLLFFWASWGGEMLIAEVW